MKQRDIERVRDGERARRIKEETRDREREIEIELEKGGGETDREKEKKIYRAGET